MELQVVKSIKFRSFAGKNQRTQKAKKSLKLHPKVKNNFLEDDPWQNTVYDCQSTFTN